MTCTAVVTKFGSSHCFACRCPVGDGIEMHFVEDGIPTALYCVAHCPIHAPKEYGAEPVTRKLW